MRDLIKRVIAREPPKIKVGLTREEKERIKRTFTTEEVWNVKVPGDFKGSKIEYLIYFRASNKEKKERELGIKKDWRAQHKCNAKVVCGDEMIGATTKKFTTANDRIYNPYGDKNQNQSLLVNEIVGVNKSNLRKKPVGRPSALKLATISDISQAGGDVSMQSRQKGGEISMQSKQRGGDISK